MIMTHAYQIAGMTCSGCVTTVKKQLESVPGIKSASVQLDAPQVTLDMEKHVEIGVLQEALKSHPKYQIKEYHEPPSFQSATQDGDQTSWQTYKPLIIVFAFILGI